MKIGVDAREIQDGVTTGIGRSLENFIRYFGNNDHANDLILFSHRSIPINFRGRIENVVKKKMIHTFFFDQITLPIAMRSAQIDIFYSPYYKIPIFTKVPVISQVLDLMYLIFPKYKKAAGCWGRVYYHIFGWVLSKKAANIITDSEHARRDIIRLWKIDPEKITRIPLGVAERYSPVKDKKILFQVKNRWSLPEKFMLYLGNFKPHKNVKSLVLAFKKVKRRLPGYKLVLAGPLDAHGKKMCDTVRDEKIEGEVIFTGTIREKDRPEALLTLADLFIFPSLYEGFGIPPLEAMACGTPVIASNMTAIPETVGDAAIKINPLDIDELGRAIIKFLDDSDLRKEYSQKGLERAKLFTEEKTAGAIYRHIMTLLEVVK